MAHQIYAGLKSTKKTTIMKKSLYFFILICSIYACNRNTRLQPQYLKSFDKGELDMRTAMICTNDMPASLQGKCKNPFSESDCYSLNIFWNECLVHEVFHGNKEAINFCSELIALIPADDLFKMNIRLLRGEEVFNALLNKMSIFKCENDYVEEYALFSKITYIIDTIDGKIPLEYFKYHVPALDFSKVDRSQCLLGIIHEKKLIIFHHLMENNLLKLKNYGQH